MLILCKKTLVDYNAKFLNIDDMEQEEEFIEEFIDGKGGELDEEALSNGEAHRYANQMQTI